MKYTFWTYGLILWISGAGYILYKKRLYKGKYITWNIHSESNCETYGLIDIFSGQMELDIFHVKRDYTKKKCRYIIILLYYKGLILVCYFQFSVLVC